MPNLIVFSGKLLIGKHVIKYIHSHTDFFGSHDHF